MSENLDPETKAALLKARALIKAREGKKAALVLHKIDHPIARKWERQINQAVDWSRQPDVTVQPERGPMPWYLWPFFALAVLWSAAVWFVGVGTSVEAFLLLCILVLIWGRFPVRQV